MNQNESNVKIKNYKHYNGIESFAMYAHLLDRPQSYPNEQEQGRMLERFKQINWQTEKTLALETHEDRMFVLRSEHEKVKAGQHQQRLDVQQHRLAHLEGIKQNIKESRERFYRRTELERPGAIEEKLGDRPLFKIVNDGTPIKY